VTQPETSVIADVTIIGSRLDVLLTKARLSQTELSRRSGVSVRTIQRALDGQEVRVVTLAALADVLDVHWEALYLCKFRRLRTRLI
jgi:transcriptional regulator with XRE-family HTH domain